MTTNMKTLLFSALTLSALNGISQTGPAGVGNSTNNTNWHDANALSLSDGFPVTTFSDISGNGNDFNQYTSTRKPTFTASATNGMPALSFDGINDYMETGADASLDASNISYFVVYQKATLDDQNMISAKYTSQSSQKWSSYCNYNNDFVYNVHMSPTTKWSRFMDDNDFTFLSTHITASSIRAYQQGVAANLNSSAFTVPSGHERTTIGRKSDATNDISCLDGYIAEVIVFNSALNALERIMIENYLGAKYNLPIPTDRFAYEGTHNIGLVGIGNDGTNSQTVAQGYGVMELSNATSLASGDYLLAAHTNDALSSFTTADIPVSITGHKRWVRTWRVDETNECGTVDIKFYLAGGNNFGASSSYRLLVDTDGNFSDATVLSGTYDGGTQTVTFSVDLNDGEYFTLAGLEQSLEIHSVTTGPWSDPNTWDCVCVPTSNDLVYIDPFNTVTVDVNADCAYLSVEPNATLVMNSAVNLNLYGDWDIIGSINFTDGSFSLVGSAAQYVDAGGGSVEFNDIIINNLSTGDVTFYEATYTLNGTLYPIEGNMVLDGGMACEFIVNSTSATEGGRIDAIDSDFTLTGEVTVYRYIPTGDAGWRNVSPSVSGANLSMWDADLEMSGEGFPDGCAYGPGGCFYSVTEFYSYAYQKVTDPNHPLELGRGYEIYMGDDTISFAGRAIKVRGTLNTGDVSETFSTGWNIHGNPYASPIDFNQLTLGNVDNYYYVRDPSTGGFEWYDGGTNTSSVPALANGYIATGQGYWAYDWGTVIFEQVDKVTNAEYFKTQEIIHNDIFHVRLYELNTTYSGSFSIQDSDIALDGFDTIADIRLLMTGTEKAPIIAFDFEEERVRKNVIFNDLRSKSFDLYTNIKNPGYYRLEGENLFAYDTYESVLIFDNVTGEFFDVKNEISYTFYSEAGEFNRFTLILSNDGAVEESNGATLGLTEENIDLSITQMGTLIDVNCTEDFGNSELTIVNTLGQVEVYRETINLVSGSNIVTLPEHLSGVHFVVIYTDKGVFTKKLVF